MKWVLFAVVLLGACGAERKPAPATVAVEPAPSRHPWSREAERLLALADRAQDQDTRAYAIREIRAFADRAAPADMNPRDVADTRQRLYARAAQLAFDSEVPDRALRLANRGLKAANDGAYRVQLLTMVARAKRALGDETGALEAEQLAQDPAE